MNNRSFLDIPRLPHERKLEGVPHARKESIFAEEGVPDAVSLVNDTHGLNSRQRRAILDATLPKSDDGLESLSNGLNLVTDLLENKDKSRHSTYLAGIVLGRLSKTSESDYHREDADASEEEILPGFMHYTDDTYDRIEKSLEADNFDPNADITKLPKDKAVSGKIRELLHLDDESDARIAEVGVELFRHYNHPSDNLDTMVARYIYFTNKVDEVKKDKLGFKGSTVITNQLTAAYAAAIANQAGPSCDRVKQLDSIENRLIGDDTSMDWYRTKIDVLRDYFIKSHLVEHYIDRYENKVLGNLSEKMFNITSPVRKRQITDETMSLLQELRRYGIKPAYFNDDITTKKPDESWVFYDPVTDGDIDFPPASPALVTIALAAEKTPADLTIHRDESSASLTKYNTGFGSRLGLQMHMNGELSIGGMINPFTLRKRFTERGHDGLYEQLRLNLVRNLFDLVAPASIVLPRDKKGKLRQIFGGSKEVTETAELLLGRVRYAKDNMSDIVKELELESTKEREIRISHDVVAHVRVLPPGYSPSDSARQDAMKHGIVLAPNETFVRKHSRGNKELGSMKSHHGVSKHPVD